MVQSRFYSATDKLMNAFLMNNITHRHCRRCAVGTLCGDVDNAQKYAAREKIGYSLDELANIEVAFEGDNDYCSLGGGNRYYDSLSIANDPDGFIGLTRVFDYLVELEDWSEEENKVNLIEMCLS